MEEIKKSLWMPVIKDAATGKYLAVLSDTSLDRDDEAMSKELIMSWGRNKSLKALVNHENKMEKWVGGWKNLKVKEKDGNIALFAEPWFFSAKSNPLAEMTKNQVDEAIANGENPGISIGAIITEYDTRKVNGKEARVFTKGELLEGTWVPIQSNRNASFGHVAKGFNAKEFFNEREEKKLEKEFTKDDLDSAVAKKVDEAKTELAKQLDEKSVELKKANEQLAEVNKSLEESKKMLEEKDSELKKAEESLKKTKEELDAQKKQALEKQKYADGGSEGEDNPEEAMKSGKLPFIRG